MITSGIYGLFRLDGGPVDRVDAARLGLPDPGVSGGVSAQGIDRRLPGAIHRYEADGATTILVGDIDAPEELAAQLELSSATPPAMLARAALERFGSETPAQMIGEWSLLHVDTARRLTLMLSAGVRDPLLYAVSSTCVAVAPSLAALGKLSWVNADIDATGLMFALGRADLRARHDDRTMLRQVRRVEAGGSVVIDHQGAIRAEVAHVLTDQPRWQGSFDDALEASERLLRQILRERLARGKVSALTLSGGLDSSIIAWLAAEECTPGQSLRLTTSVAPTFSPHPDERQFADVVAQHLGLSTEHIAPPEALSIYRPDDAMFENAIGPPLATRHSLTRAFEAYFDQQHASMALGGVFGEMTLTAGMAFPGLRARLRQMTGRMRRAITQRHVPPSVTGPFHARMARHRVARLPDEVDAALAAPSIADSPPPPDGLWGYLPGAAKSLLVRSEGQAGGTREIWPFRDVRLLRLFAGFPVEYMTHGGLNRSMARHMLQGHLPDAIRLRTGGLPASPDHLDRLQRQAQAARARIAVYRKADIDEWIDIDWLDTALGRVATQGVASYADGNEVQLTAMAAEYLTWWRTRV